MIKELGMAGLYNHKIQSEESDASIEPEPSKKSPVRKKKTSPKKKADKEEKALSDSEKEENVKWILKGGKV